MIPLVIPIGVGVLIGAAAWATRKPKGEMTPERTIVYDTALKTVKDPEKLKILSEAFRKEGLTAQADLLQKRATLRELPPDVKEARRAAFRKGMASTDPKAVNELADAFEKEGASGAADALRKYASGLKPVTATPETPKAP
jgi:hypothetical protein